MDYKSKIGKPLSFEFYNQRNSEILSVMEGYNKWSKNYNELDDSFDIDLLESTSCLKNIIMNKEILDIGCGTGRIGKWLKKFSPSKITGLDQNRQMIEIAQNDKIYDEFIMSDLFKHNFKNQTYSGITSSLMACHIEDIELFYKTVAGRLKDDGWFCIIDFHPFMLLNGVPTKFEDKETSIPYSIKNYIHSLSDHFNSAANNNLKLAEFHERFVNDEWIAGNKAIEKYKGKAISFLMLFEKIQ